MCEHKKLSEKFVTKEGNCYWVGSNEEQGNLSARIDTYLFSICENCQEITHVSWYMMEHSEFHSEKFKKIMEQFVPAPYGGYNRVFPAPTLT